MSKMTTRTAQASVPPAEASQTRPEVGGAPKRAARPRGRRSTKPRAPKAPDGDPGRLADLWPEAARRDDGWTWFYEQANR
jgi:hypothetical protein